MDSRYKMVLAGPESKGGDHGCRERTVLDGQKVIKMNIVKFMGVAVLALALTACSNTDSGEKQTVGTLLGAGLGALAGSQFGGGKGQLAAAHAASGMQRVAAASEVREFRRMQRRVARPL